MRELHNNDEICDAYIDHDDEEVVVQRDYLVDVVLERTGFYVADETFYITRMQFIWNNYKVNLEK